jgi:hypothetical protein
VPLLGHTFLHHYGSGVHISAILGLAKTLDNLFETRCASGSEDSQQEEDTIVINSGEWDRVCYDRGTMST